ncbi:hypothetical protein DRQ53_01695 [bacterium]|nr:MAG: hypothetical protein DRQ32_05500 [bacterium]RKZ18000.1 MAG: hypothetical protein DRQ53_01695 [bacterium]
MFGGWGHRGLKLAVFVAGAICCGFISTQSGAFDTWDLRNYQFYSPYALLNGRFAFDHAAAQIQTFLNPLPFVPFYWLVTHFKPVVAGFLMGAVHGLSAGFAFLVALSVLARIPAAPRVFFALSCTVLGVYGPTFVAMLGGSGSDHVVCLFVLAAVYLLIRSVPADGEGQTGDMRALVAGAVLLGIAAGLKLTGVVFLVGALMAVFATRRGWASRFRDAGLLAFAGLVGLLISRGAWMSFLWRRYESPLFPFFNEWFGSPWFHDTNFADARFVPDSLAGALLLPLRFFTNNDFTLLSHEFRDLRYSVIYGLLVIGLVVTLYRVIRPGQHAGYGWPRLDRRGQFLLIFSVVSYLIWQVKFAIMRYIVPLEFLAPILIVILLQALLRNRRSALSVAAVALVLVAIVVQPRSVMRRQWEGEYLQVQAPQLENPESALVIVANDRPWSYVIPFFQPEVRFIGLWNRFSRDEAKLRHRATDEMWEIVEAHQGPIYLLTSGGQLDAARLHLPRYTTVRQRNRPQVVSAHEKSSLYLWRLRAR